jgi:hypothetical protein
MANWSAAAVLAMAVVGTAGARGDVVYNNFGPGDAFSDSGRLVQGETVGTIGNVDQASTFRTGASDSAVTSVTVGINATTAGPLDILIAADGVGGPGATLRTLSANANLGKQALTVNDVGTLVLDANTTYWVIVDGKTTFDGGWNENSIGETGFTAGRTNLGAWSQRSVDELRLALRVEGRLVPEPAGIGFVAAAAASCGVGRRRSRTR